MGQDFLSASVQVLCDQMASTELRDLFSQRNLDDDSLDRLGGKLSTLCAVLNYAKQQQVTNPAVRDWLGKLRDVVFDVEDLLGEITSTSSTAQVLQRPTDGLTTKVLNFLSTSFNLCNNNQGVDSRIEELLQILEHLAEQKDSLFDEMVRALYLYIFDFILYTKLQEYAMITTHFFSSNTFMFNYIGCFP